MTLKAEFVFVKCSYSQCFNMHVNWTLELSHVLFIYDVATALALLNNTPRSHLPLEIHLNL